MTITDTTLRQSGLEQCPVRTEPASDQAPDLDLNSRSNRGVDEPRDLVEVVLAFERQSRRAGGF